MITSSSTAVSRKKPSDADSCIEGKSVGKCNFIRRFRRPGLFVDIDFVTVTSSYAFYPTFPTFLNVCLQLSMFYHCGELTLMLSQIMLCQINSNAMKDYNLFAF